MITKQTIEYINTTIVCIVSSDSQIIDYSNKLKKYNQVNCLEIIFILDSPLLKKKIIEIIKKNLFIDVKILCCPFNKTIYFPELLTYMQKLTRKKFVFLCQFLPSIDTLISSVILAKEHETSIIKVLSQEQYSINEYREIIDTDKIMNTNWALLVQVSACSKVSNYSLQTNIFTANLLYFEHQLHILGYITLINIIYDNIQISPTPIDNIGVSDLSEIYYPRRIKKPIYSKNRYLKQVFSTNRISFKKYKCFEYLKYFKKHDIKYDELSRKHKILGLVPAYNESKRLPDFLNHIKSYCDGIILLDDDSSDNTYELADDPIVKLRVSKSRNEFNDLENRNILLRLSSLFKSEWLFFIDVDEKFDSRFGLIKDFTNKKNVNTIAFQYVNLWNTERYYRTNMWEATRTNLPGVFYRWRMFRNNGNMQLFSNQKLHFNTTPYVDNPIFSTMLIKHYGYLSNINRDEKYKFYKKEDTKEILDYQFILEKEIILNDIKQIKMEHLESNAKYLNHMYN